MKFYNWNHTIFYINDEKINMVCFIRLLNFLKTFLLTSASNKNQSCNISLQNILKSSLKKDGKPVLSCFRESTMSWL